MEKSTQHTNKPCIINQVELWENEHHVYQRLSIIVEGSPKIGELFELAVIEECGPLTDEKVGNAILIMEAFNVAHESGLTPRQLLDGWEKARNNIAAKMVELKEEREEVGRLMKECKAHEEQRDEAKETIKR